MHALIQAEMSACSGDLTRTAAITRLHGERTLVWAQCPLKAGWDIPFKEAGELLAEFHFFLHKTP